MEMEHEWSKWAGRRFCILVCVTGAGMVAGAPLLIATSGRLPGVDAL